MSLYLCLPRNSLGWFCQNIVVKSSEFEKKNDTRTTPVMLFWCFFNFECISYLFLAFLLLVLNNKVIAGWLPLFWSYIIIFVKVTIYQENILKLQNFGGSLPLDTVRKLNVYSTFERYPGCLLNVLRTFSLRPVSREINVLLRLIVSSF